MNLQPREVLHLWGDKLRWVDAARVLGHELTIEATMDTDARMKRATFISRSTEVREKFHFARPTDVLNAVMLYCCDYMAPCCGIFAGRLPPCFSTP